MQKSKIKSFDDNILDQLTGTPAVRPEYYIRERRVVRAEITVERAVNITGLGATGAFGSGFYINDVFT
jgi:hypothetical protein